MTELEVAKSWFEDVWNCKDCGHVEELLAEHCHIEGLTAQTMTRSWQFQEYYTRFNIAFTSINVTVDSLLAQNERVAGLVSFTAKHRRSGRTATFRISFQAKIEGGKVLEVVNVYDHLGLLTNLGLLDADEIDKALFG
jgi:hypothetical protein